MRRLVFIVLDGVGVGALPDAAAYGDTGSDTLGNLSRVVQLRLPVLRRMGMGNIIPILAVPPVEEPSCLIGRLAPLSAGKDTSVGHWEHMGLVTADPLPTYPHGFPDEILRPFTERIGRGFLGNKPASGTAIIAELGDQHVTTGKPIVYTSADSVFQIATHVDVVPLEQLYAWCQIARDLLSGRHGVARVIARPFAGPAGAFFRTRDRRDFSLAPAGPTYLDVLHEAGVPVLALGKISEVFAGRGVSTAVKVGSNEENLTVLIDLVRRRSSHAAFDRGLLITNLVDFDMLWGHRNDADGFARGLETVDTAMAEILGALEPDDRLIVTADHGVDPTTPSTDHSREYVPLLYHPRPADAPAAVYEGMFADTGATVCSFLVGKECGLQGTDMGLLRPARGWRRYTPVQPPPGDGPTALPGRVGSAEVAAAAEWLKRNVGAPADLVVVLGSGLAPAPGEPPVVEIPYSAVPHWLMGTVPGHPSLLTVTNRWGLGVAFLQGRAHEYEGYDLSEVQLPLRSLAAWGVRRLVLTSASGAVDQGLAAGQVVIITEVLDMHHPSAGGGPARLPATDAAMLAAPGLVRGAHASLPGPQYETPAELALLRTMGAVTVSMSPAAELRAAHEEGMVTAVLAVVVNCGDTTHEGVLAGATRSAENLSAAIGSVVGVWRAETADARAPGPA